MAEKTSMAPRVTRRTMLAAGGLAAAALVAKGGAAQSQHAPDPVMGGENENAKSSEPIRSIEEIRPGIFRARENRHYTVVIVGAESVAVFDTLNHDFATWLDAEISKRFKKPVRYVIYSHNHADHVSGGEAFAYHKPIYISHRLARDSMVRMKVATQIPETTFEDRLDILLDGLKIELRYHGPNDGRGSISLLIPEKRVLSVIDWVVIGRLPYRDLARYDIEGMIRSLHDINKLDFEVAIPGHADIGGKAHILVSRRYLEALRDGVIAGVAARKPLDVIVTEVRTKLASVPQFKALKQFDDWVNLNIRGAYRQLASIEGFLDG